MKDESKMLSVPVCKKVWIFKWLVKKHNCEVYFDYDWEWKDRKKTQKIWFATPKLLRDGKDFVLSVASKEFPAMVLSICLPSKHVALTYADVLDTLLNKIKKVGSDCFLRSVGWPYTRAEVFLPKDITLENLCIEFDLAWRDAFGLSLKA